MGFYGLINGQSNGLTVRRTTRGIGMALSLLWPVTYQAKRPVCEIGVSSIGQGKENGLHGGWCALSAAIGIKIRELKGFYGGLQKSVKLHSKVA